MMVLFMRYCPSSAAMLSGCASHRRLNSEVPRIVRASWFVTSGGSCWWSPTSTNASASRSGARQCGSVT
eukprot:312663-Rhodomonas_salina.1